MLFYAHSLTYFMIHVYLGEYDLCGHATIIKLFCIMSIMIA